MTDPMPSPEQAARRAVDADGLLPGESTASGLGEAADAVHWLTVYRELLTFKEEMLAEGRSRMEALSEVAREEARTDTVIMEAEAERFRRRIAVWRGRLHELGLERDRADVPRRR